ncbi:MAG: DUF2807 domain-containing protein, partial [Cyclobacteriaceae bacterium]
MKKSILTLVFFSFLSGLAFAQSEETRSLSSFSKVSAQESIEVYLKKGDKEEARVVSDNIDLSDVRTDVSLGRLKIHIEDNDRWSRNRNVDVKVYVTYKSVNALSSSSSSSIEVEDKLETSGDFDVDVSSSGYVRASLKADEL